MLVEMLKNMLPSIMESAAIVLAFVVLGVLCIYLVARAWDSHYNSPTAKVSYIEEMVDLLKTNTNIDPSLKASTFKTISNLTEKADAITVNEVYKPRLETLKKKMFWREQARCCDMWKFFMELRQDKSKTFEKIVEMSFLAKHDSHKCYCGGHSHDNPDEVTQSMFTKRRMIHVERYKAVEELQVNTLKEVARRALEGFAKSGKNGKWFGLALGWVTEANAVLGEVKEAVSKYAAAATRGEDSVFTTKLLIEEQFLVEKKVEALNVVAEATKGESNANKVEVTTKQFNKIVECIPAEGFVDREYERLTKKLK